MILFLCTLYDICTIFDKNIWIDTFYSILLKSVWTKSNHKKIELSDSTNAYTYFFYNFEREFASSYYMMYVWNWKIIFYNVMISNACKGYNHYKSILILYSIVT